MKEAAVVERVLALVAGFGKGLTRPEQKFLQDLVLGILCSQSSLLSEIARAVCDTQKLNTIYDRLDMNLGKYDLTRAYERAQRRMLEGLDESYLLIFDPSEIVKPFAKKMEGLRPVRDGSEPMRLVWDKKRGEYKPSVVLKPGYPLRIAIALSPNGDVLPLELTLYSGGSETFLSENDEHLQPLTHLLAQTDFKTLLVLDRGFDSYVFIRHFCELNQRFVIRLKSNRKYKVPGSGAGTKAQTYSREHMIEKYSFLASKSIVTYTRAGVTEPLLFSFSAASVELLPETQKRGAHPFRSASPEKDHDLLTLVRVQIHKAEEKVPTLYLLTNTRPKTAEELERIGRAYLARWNVEEYIRFLKQHFRLEDFLVRDLGRMKNLMMGVYIATAVIHLLTDRNSLRGAKTHHLLIEKSRPVAKPKRTRDFHLYAYGRGLARVVRANQALLNRVNDGAKTSEIISENQLSFSMVD
jgi:Transposase DDE domain